MPALYEFIHLTEIPKDLNRKSVFYLSTKKFSSKVVA